MYNRVPVPPKKGGFSYLLPFLIIIGMGVLVVLLYNFFTNQPETLEVGGDAKVYVSLEEGSAKVKLWGEDRMTAVQDGDTLFMGDRITTAEDALVVLKFFDKSVVRLGPNTDLTLDNLSNQGGNTIAATLNAGSAWVVVNGDNSEVFFATENTLTTVDGTTFAVSVADEEAIYVLEGEVKTSVVRENVMTGRSEPLQNFTLETSEQLVINEEKIAALENGDYTPAESAEEADGSEGDVSLVFREPIADEFRESDWFRLNATLDGKLEIFESDGEGEAVTEEVDEEELEEEEEGADAENILVVSSPESGNTYNTATVTVSGKYWLARVSAVLVDGRVAKLEEGVWTITMQLSSEGENVFKVEAVDGEDEVIADESLVVIRDTVAPAAPQVTGPMDGDVITSEEGFVLKGSVSSDTQKVIVTDSAQSFAYALSAYLPGETSWKYNAKAQFGNLKEGTNTYTIVAVDKAGNKSAETMVDVIYEPVKEKVAEMDETAEESVSEEEEASLEEESAESEETTVESEEEGSEEKSAETEEETTEEEEDVSVLPAPIITIPTAEGSYTAAVNQIAIGGTVNQNTAKIYVNGGAISYTAGSTRWSTVVDLNEGDNAFRVWAESKGGVKSDTVNITITYE